MFSHAKKKIVSQTQVKKHERELKKKTNTRTFLALGVELEEWSKAGISGQRRISGKPGESIGLRQWREKETTIELMPEHEIKTSHLDFCFKPKKRY